MKYPSKYLSLIICLLGLLLAPTGALSSATDISGTWECSVDLGGDLRPNEKLVFKQEGENLTGTYSGPLGEHKFTGTVKGKKTEFSFDMSAKGKPPLTITHTGTIVSPTKMTGDVEYPGRPGKWTATKK
jgi:hypothetical protein